MANVGEFQACLCRVHRTVIFAIAQLSCYSVFEYRD